MQTLIWPFAMSPVPLPPIVNAHTDAGTPYKKVTSFSQISMGVELRGHHFAIFTAEGCSLKDLLQLSSGVAVTLSCP